MANTTEYDDMPIIREYEQTVSNQTGGGGPRATESSFVNRGLDYVAGAVGQVADTLARVQDQNSNLEVQATAAKAKADWQQQYNQMEKEEADKGGDAAGFTDRFKEKFAEYKTKVANDSSLRPRYKERLALEFDRIEGFYVDNSVKFEARQGGIAASNKVQQIGNTLQNTVMADPSQAGDAVRQYHEMIDGLSVIQDGKTRDQLKREGEQSINRAYVFGVTEQIDRLNAASKDKAVAYQDALDSIRTNEYLKANMRPEDYGAALNLLQKKVEHEKAAGDQTFAFGLKIANDKLATTGIATPGYDEKTIRENVPPGVPQEQAVMQYRTAAAVGGEITATKDMPIPDMVARINGLKSQMETQTGVNYEVAEAKFKAAVSVYQSKVEAMSRDPAGTMASNDTITSAKAAQFAADSGNPLKAQDYAATQILRQKTVMPNMPPRILSEGMVDGFKRQLQSYANDPNGVEAQRQVLIGEAAKWGPHWPKVASEYFAGKAMNEYQYVASGMSAASQSVTDELVRAASVKDADLKANLVVGSDYQKRVKTAVSDALADFRQTLQPGRGNGAQVLSAYQESIERMILVRSMDGKDHASDAKDLAQKVLGSEFRFVDGLRIPINVNSDSVLKGANDKRLSVVFSADLLTPPGYRGQTEDEKRKVYQESLKAYGRFVTKGDNSGVFFVDSNGDYVRSKSGKPIEFSWAELTAPKAVPQKLPSGTRTGPGGGMAP